MMDSARSMLTLLAATLIAATSPALVGASEVKIDNVSNVDISVAIAYRNYRGDLICEGWFVIKSNESKTFSAEGSSDMYIRVMKNGQEVKWRDRDTYSNWPVHPTERFSVSKSPLNDRVRIYRWGANLENDDNKRIGDPIPMGFEVQRFFRIGRGARLDVLP